MDDANDVVTSNLQLKLRPFSTESSKSEQQQRLVLQALDGARRRREMLCWLQHNFSQAELNCTFFRELELVHTCRLTLLASFVRLFEACKQCHSFSSSRNVFASHFITNWDATARTAVHQTASICTVCCRLQLPACSRKAPSFEN